MLDKMHRNRITRPDLYRVTRCTSNGVARASGRLPRCVNTRLLPVSVLAIGIIGDSSPSRVVGRMAGGK
jgi:hypothetical protein